MKGVLEVLMKKILFKENLKNIKQFIILKVEGRVKGYPKGLKIINIQRFGGHGNQHFRVDYRLGYDFVS